MRNSGKDKYLRQKLPCQAVPILIDGKAAQPMS